ncbi:MAG TPA: ABC-F family ATP-binding cassette domain-containing protein [Gaiellaceae bacterium]|jgi:ATPase subunit of ABC transporter with duplicated ATPase domains|nr:ABC-F family ATP-binding cassette domain-containing protein [Gaiellaceae bacterium]
MHSGGTLAANDVTIHRGADAILERVSLTVTPGSRIGVVGPNGRGKTTLLRALAGLEPLDRGTVSRNPPTLRVGYLPQERDLTADETLHSYLARRTGIADAEAELGRLESALEHEASLAGAHAEALERFLALGGADFAARARGVLAEVALDASLDRPAGELSGGEKGRAALASILLARFDVFLLDEPTNDLDFAGLELLERFLLGIEGGVVLVSHDRALLDRTVNRIVELESGTQRMHVYPGGWSEYEAARAEARAEHEQAYARWTEERGRFARLHHERRDQARAGGKQASRRGTHALMSKTRAAARRVELLDRDRIEKPWQPWELQLDLAPRDRSGDLVVSLEGAVLVRGSFRLGPIDVHVGWGERISIAGPNGSGKTTLLDALLGRLPLAAGRRRAGPSVVFGEIGQARTLFPPDEPLLKCFCSETGLREGEARTLLAKFDLYAAHLLRRAGGLSPGERTRAELAVQAARGAGCLVLDEPTNHLDLPAVEELERALSVYSGTLLVVTHDRRFLERIGVTRVVELSPKAPARGRPRAPRRPPGRR